MKLFYRDPTIISLIIANIITIFLAVTQNWSLIQILWIYWCQSIIIGFFNFIRMLSLKDFSTEGVLINNKPVAPTGTVKTLLAFFFAFHYGLFHLGYAFFLIMLPLFSLFSGSQINFSFTDFLFVPIMAGIFFINHLISFLFYKNKHKKQSIGKVMIFPYARIIPMHFTIMLAAVIGIANPLLLLFFLLLKTVADTVMHVIEHKEQWI